MLSKLRTRSVSVRMMRVRAQAASDAEGKRLTHGAHGPHASRVLQKQIQKHTTPGSGVIHVVTHRTNNPAVQCLSTADCRLTAISKARFSNNLSCVRNKDYSVGRFLGSRFGDPGSRCWFPSSGMSSSHRQFARDTVPPYFRSPQSADVPPCWIKNSKV